MVGINRRKEITGKFDSLQWKIRDTSKYIDLDGIFNNSHAVVAVAPSKINWSKATIHGTDFVC